MPRAGRAAAEPIEHWTLTVDDLGLLERKTGHTRLGFALLLKAFQYEGRFPEHKNDLPSAVVAHVAAQVGTCLAEAARRYSGAARPHVRHVDYQGRPGEVTCILALARVRVIALAKTVRVDQGAGGVYDTRRFFMVSTTG